jgi:hypothetical protein
LYSLRESVPLTHLLLPDHKRRPSRRQPATVRRLRLLPRVTNFSSSRSDSLSIVSFGRPGPPLDAALSFQLLVDGLSTHLIQQMSITLS